MTTRTIVSSYQMRKRRPDAPIDNKASSSSWQQAEEQWPNQRPSTSSATTPNKSSSPGVKSRKSTKERRFSEKSPSLGNRRSPRFNSTLEHRQLEPLITWNYKSPNQIVSTRTVPRRIEKQDIASLVAKLVPEDNSERDPPLLCLWMSQAEKNRKLQQVKSETTISSPAMSFEKKNQAKASLDQLLSEFHCTSGNSSDGETDASHPTGAPPTHGETSKVAGGSSNAIDDVSWGDDDDDDLFSNIDVVPETQGYASQLTSKRDEATTSDTLRQPQSRVSDAACTENAKTVSGTPDQLAGSRSTSLNIENRKSALPPSTSRGPITIPATTRVERDAQVASSSSLTVNPKATNALVIATAKPVPPPSVSRSQTVTSERSAHGTQSSTSDLFSFWEVNTRKPAPPPSLSRRFRTEAPSNTSLATVPAPTKEARGSLPLNSSMSTTVSTDATSTGYGSSNLARSKPGCGSYTTETTLRQQNSSIASTTDIGNASAAKKLVPSPPSLSSTVSATVAPPTRRFHFKPTTSVAPTVTVPIPTQIHKSIPPSQIPKSAPSQSLACTNRGGGVVSTTVRGGNDSDDSAIWGEDDDDSMFANIDVQKFVSSGTSSAPPSRSDESVVTVKSDKTDKVFDSGGVSWDDDDDSLFMNLEIPVVVDKPSVASLSTPSTSFNPTSGERQRAPINFASSSTAVVANAYRSTQQAPLRTEASVTSKKRPASAEDWTQANRSEPRSSNYLEPRNGLPGVNVVSPTTAAPSGASSVRCSPEEIQRKKRLALEKRQKTMHQSHPNQNFR